MIYEVLKKCAASAGGSSAALVLWPDKKPLIAANDLFNCLSKSHASALTPGELVKLLRIGRDRGDHGGIAALCELAGYAPPQPRSSAEEIADIQRKFIALGGKLAEQIPTLRASVVCKKHTSNIS